MSKAAGGVVALALLLALAGLPAMVFGAVEPWAEEWLRMLALLAFAAVAWTSAPRQWFRGPSGALVLPAVALLLWSVFQVVPLPRAVIGLLAPRTAALYAATVPEGDMLPWLLQRAAAAGYRVDASQPPPPTSEAGADPTVGATLSISPPSTRRAILAWIAPLLLFVTAARVAVTPLARYRLLWGVAMWGGVLGLLAIAQSISWNGRMLWLRRTPPDILPLGPFVNRSHYAGYVELALLVALGLLLATLSRATGRLDAPAIRGAITDRAWALPRVIALVVLLALPCAGLILSGSRGGWVATASALVVLPFARRGRGWVPVLAIVVVVIALGISIAAWVGPPREGLQQGPFAPRGIDASTAQRLDAYATMLRIVADAPVAGTGLGTFRWAFARHQREGEWGVWQQAHNDYLQLVVETGIVGLGLLAWALVALTWRVLAPALRAGVGGQPRWTTAAVGSAVLAMLVHTAVDFNLQIPGVACLFAILLGVLAAAAGDHVGSGQAAT